MIKNLGAFAAGMALREQKEKESNDYLKEWQRTGKPEYLDKAEKASEEADQYGFYGITQGMM